MASKRKALAESASPSSKKAKSVSEPSCENGVTEEEVFANEEVRVRTHRLASTKNQAFENDEETKFIGDPVDGDEAQRRWPHRYQQRTKRGENQTVKSSNDNDEFIQARRHFTRANVDGHVIYELEDKAHVQAEEGNENYICKIVEMFEGIDGNPYFTAQWFYRAKDTVIAACSNIVDDKRVFLSEVKDDNPLDCLVEKIKIEYLPLNSSSKDAAPSDCTYYCDMMYLLPYSSFMNLPLDYLIDGGESDSTVSSEVDEARTSGDSNIYLDEISRCDGSKKRESLLLDLYSGCGAMSTGLCLGANISGVPLVTKWAVDLNPYACKSLQLNHPETEVRNESAENFLSLLKEWEKLCMSFSLLESNNTTYVDIKNVKVDESEDEENDADAGEDDDEIFEVEQVLAICYGDPNNIKQPGLYLKIRWKGYGPDEDSWEPINGLSDCPERIKEFVTNGFKSNILPLPGRVDVICGGPPCQGISGFNRFRKREEPLSDEKNKQLLVFMDIVDYLKPRYVLMENVVDLIKFSNGFLGRYALAKLVAMNYQTRLGMMAAGAYGLPQFRMRVFLWGARPQEKLPQYALPTHDVVVRGVIPTEFESNTVAYEEKAKADLEKALFLEDAISDLPWVENNEPRDEMPYGPEAKTEFQKFIRRRRDEMPGYLANEAVATSHELFDHRPLKLNEDDYQRVCQIPKRKGANFRDLSGVRVRDNKVEWDPDVERVYLPSGKPLVPDYAMTFVGGTSSKPFGRLWWDETVPTVVGRAEPHNQAILHPSQDRVLTIRENARLQGFPDYYKLIGPIKERYIQVGNAVAVPVARALGYALGLAIQGICTEEGPLLTLPPKFPEILEPRTLASDADEND